MRKAILLLVILVGVSLSCVECGEMLTLSDDTSNDFVVALSGQKCSLPQAAKEQPAGLLSHFTAAIDLKIPLLAIIGDIVLPCQNLIREFGVQRK